MTKPFPKRRCRCHPRIAMGPTSLRVTSVPQNNTGSHFYVKKSQKTCDCLCEWYGPNSEDAGKNECRRFYVFFLSWPCLANTPIRESQSLNKNIIAGKFDFTVVIFHFIQHLLLVLVWWSKQVQGTIGLKKSWKIKIYVKTPLIFRSLIWIAVRLLGAASHLIGRFQRAKFLWPTKLYCSRGLGERNTICSILESNTSRQNHSTKQKMYYHISE